MKISKNKKYFIFTLLFAVIFFMTIHTILNHNKIEDVIKNLSSISIPHILLCIVLVISYFVFQGIYMKRNLKLLREKISLKDGIFYSMVEFFFSGITPSSTGGQPVQLYYMNKDKIENKKGAITLLINTIYFKLIIVILGVAIFIFKHNLIFHLSPLFIFFYCIGIVADLLMVIGGYLLLYKQSILKKILILVEKLVKLFFKNYEMKIDDNIEQYTKEVKKMGKHKKELTFEFFITFIQRMCMFSISYVVYRAFGLTEFSYLEIVIIQIAVQTAIEFIPLPGGTGVSEYLFSIFYLLVFDSFVAPTAMLVTRTFTFYIPLTLCGLIILIKYIKDIIMRRKNEA